jgi:hypothetical protein
MAVARYAWTCPGCGKQFAVRAGLAPTLCPACETQAGPVPSEIAMADPGDIIPHAGHRAARPLNRPQSVPALLKWAFDPGFERYVTPWIIRVLWLVVLLAAGTSITIGTALLATGRWTPGPPPASLSPGLWNFLSWLALVGGTTLIVLFARVLCEWVIVLFQIARTLDALRRATEHHSSKPQDQ